MQPAKLPYMRVIGRNFIVCFSVEQEKEKFRLERGDILIFVKRHSHEIDYRWTVLTRLGLLSTLCDPDDSYFWE